MCEGSLCFALTQEAFLRPVRRHSYQTLIAGYNRRLLLHWHFTTRSNEGALVVEKVSPHLSQVEATLHSSSTLWIKLDLGWRRRRLLAVLGKPRW